MTSTQVVIKTKSGQTQQFIQALFQLLLNPDAELVHNLLRVVLEQLCDLTAFAPQLFVQYLEPLTDRLC